MTNLLEEVKNFRRLLKGSEAITFYAESKEYYPDFEGLVEELDNPCYITSGPNDPVLSQPRTFYLNSLLPFYMALANCKVLVMTMPDLNQFHIRRSIHPVHYVYVFHSLVSTHMTYRFGAFDHYDSIFCVGPHQIREIRKREELYGLKPKKLIEVGYYRLEKLCEAYKKYNKESNGVNVLVAPTWGPTNLVEICSRELLEVLAKEGYKVTLRLHPETVKRNKFADYDGVTLETSVVGMNSLIEADILITEWSGIGLKYAFGTERPVIFIDTPPKVRNPKYKELGIEPVEALLRNKIGVIVPLNELSRIPGIVKDFMADREMYRETIAGLRKEYVFNFGTSSKVGADYIRGLV